MHTFILYFEIEQTINIILMHVIGLNFESVYNPQVQRCIKLDS